jgi:hypothetical protein
MALALDKSAWRFAGLVLQFLLLLTNPAEPGNRIGTGDIQAGGDRSNERNATVGRMHG